jgi:hypothetical protein
MTGFLVKLSMPIAMIAIHFSGDASRYARAIVIRRETWRRDSEGPRTCWVVSFCWITPDSRGFAWQHGFRLPQAADAYIPARITVTYHPRRWTSALMDPPPCRSGSVDEPPTGKRSILAFNPASLIGQSSDRFYAGP